MRIQCGSGSDLDPKTLVLVEWAFVCREVPCHVLSLQPERNRKYSTDRLMKSTLDGDMRLMSGGRSVNVMKLGQIWAGTSIRVSLSLLLS